MEENKKTIQEMNNKDCEEYLNNLRKILHAKPEERIDRRYKPYLAPNGKYYNAHCGYCAEVEYLLEIYKDKESKKEI